jgi:hypothetical protein
MEISACKEFLQLDSPKRKVCIKLIIKLSNYKNLNAERKRFSPFSVNAPSYLSSQEISTPNLKQF